MEDILREYLPILIFFIIAVGLASFDDVAYVDNSVLEAFVDNPDEIERIKSSAEDAALMEAMGAITEEEENLDYSSFIGTRLFQSRSA